MRLKVTNKPTDIWHKAGELAEYCKTLISSFLLLTPNKILFFWSRWYYDKSRLVNVKIGFEKRVGKIKQQAM